MCLAAAAATLPAAEPSAPVSPRMNRAELVEAVRRELGPGATRADADRAVRAVLEAIGTGLRRDRGVQLVGFGTFKVATSGPRQGTNLQTGEPLLVPPTTSVRFTAGLPLRKRL